MEDVWRVLNWGVDRKNFADKAENKRLLQRFTANEETENRRKLLFAEDDLATKGDSSTD